MQVLGFDSSKYFTVVGQVRYLPESVEHYFDHLVDVPQVYVLVDSLRKLDRSDSEAVSITPMAFFSGYRGIDFDDKSEGGVTYVTCRAGSDKELAHAKDFISWYVEKYGEKVITNYDQQVRAFADAPFSLQNIMAGAVNPQDLRSMNIHQAHIICETIHAIHSAGDSFSFGNVKDAIITIKSEQKDVSQTIEKSQTAPGGGDV
jgi:hypothetical protein